MKPFLSFLMLLSLMAPLLMTTACASSAPEHELHLASTLELPPEAQSAAARVQEAYSFAIANPEPLKNVPCFCGCDKIGHQDNYDCYIKDAPNNGKIIFDEHALGCGICVDITQDVMGMTHEGRSPPQIQRTIINTYSQFGPSNFPD